VLKFFLEKLEDEDDVSFPDDIHDDNNKKDIPYDDDIPF